MAAILPSLNLYPSESYTFGSAKPTAEGSDVAAGDAANAGGGVEAAGASASSGAGPAGRGGATVPAPSSRELKGVATASVSEFKARYEKDGFQRDVRAVLMLHGHRHPHVLLLRREEKWELPGGMLTSGEGDRAGLQALLTAFLAAVPGPPPEWEIGEALAVWHRLHFDEHVYPYVPPHVTEPKGSVKVFLCRLPANVTFVVPSGIELVAVPLIELYDAAATYGEPIAALPELLSRFRVNYLEADDA